MPNTCRRFVFAGVLIAAIGVAACSHDGARSEASASAATTSQTPASQNGAAAAGKPAESARPASQTGGCEGAKAYDQIAKIVSLGPRPPGSEGIHHVQD